MNNKILITTYKNPDIDGYASIIGLNDILKSQGKETEMSFYGDFSPETNYIADLLKEKLPITDNFKPNDYSTIILIDTSNPESTQTDIDPKKIKQIIDHRIEIDDDDFPWAEKQIELVGSCATLITEKYLNNNLTPNKNIATFLYGAIISNTVNFKNKVTTDRDIKATDYLHNLIKIPDNFIKKMFESKSDFDGKKLEYHLEHDHKEQNVTGKKFTMFQIEAAGIDHLIQKRLQEIRELLKTMTKNRNYDFYLLNCIDILDGYTRIIALDGSTQKLLEAILSVKFIGDIAMINHIIMRKEIMAKIKEYLENEHC